MTKHKVVDMERKKDRARRYTGYYCTLSDGRHVNAWVSSDELDIEFHGVDLKTVCKIAVERATESALASGEVLASRALLIEVEQREESGRR